MSEDLRAGIIGYGLSGSVFHAPLIEATPGIAVAAIVTSDAERAANARTAHPEAAVVPDVGALLSMADQLDFVVVTTPNDTHVPFALQVIAAGLHVVIEKPVAVTSAEAREIARAARERGVTQVAFQNRRWDADFLTLQDAVAANPVGEVFRLESRMHDFEPEVTSAWRNRPDPGLGGGAVFDLGAHLIDQAIQFMGAAVSVYAEIDLRRANAEVPDDFLISLVHSGGRRSHISGAVIGSGPQPRFHAQGTHGSVTILGRDGQEDQLARGVRPGDQRWGVLQHPFAAVVDAAGEYSSPAVTGSQETFYSSLRSHIIDGSEPPVGPDEPAYVLAVIEAAYLSSAEGRVVSFVEEIS